ncbi:hypothetical protein DL95DRAFT_418832 [Leptodontidium sp. 2 PMI_412]|nr:hypothetical protein DL95DRAFT_418832 [Leptodontidium sp. 2 PMI_412]
MDSGIESVITAGINKEIQDSSPKRKASSSFFTPRKAKTLRPTPIIDLPLHIKAIIYDIDFQIKELNNQINHLIEEFNTKFLEPPAINTTNFNEVELKSDDDFEIFEE